jgi:hypothetical protein
MKDETKCKHTEATINFQRTGTRLHPNIWMEEVCIACKEVLDRKSLIRGESQFVNEKRA